MGVRQFSLSEAGRACARTLARTLALACLALPLSGCFVGYEHPDLNLEVPDSYTAARKSRDADLPPLDWWRGFRSRELTLLMEEAQTANLDIAAAVARIEQADAQVRIANATLLPVLDANFSATRERTAILGGTLRGGSPVSSLYNLNLTASYTLDFWGRNRATLLAAEDNAIASRFDKDVVALTTLVSVANTYFAALDAQDRLRVARENLDASSRILDLIKQREQAGTASQLEVSQQESLVATQRASIPPLEITLRQSKAALAVLVGRAPEHFILAGGSTYRIGTPRIAPGLPSELLNQRPDIRMAEENLRSANFTVESARAAFFPTISLTGETGFESLALKTLFGPGAWFYTMAASATQPIFHGGALTGALEQAQGRQLELLQDYRKAVLSGFSDVEQALIAVQQQALHERYQREVVRASKQAFDISYQRLQQGTLDMVTLTQTQQTLFTAQDVLAQVRLSRLQAVVSLYQALGGGWSPTRPELAASAARKPGYKPEPSPQPKPGSAPH
ncbi:MAG TPA: efflux transporter outer membrane subunit [Xanthobacteraceae bacterium]|nr:efflux transporter outer membrane subunit [Xanthobacteraceae bacterium]